MKTSYIFRRNDRRLLPFSFLLNMHDAYQAENLDCNGFMLFVHLGDYLPSLN